MKIAALYARVSSAKQQLNENIASQVAAIEEYARQNDYQISPQHVYKDDGFSGARLDRPDLDRLRDAVAQGEVEAVLILSPDRLARQFAYQYIGEVSASCLDLLRIKIQTARRKLTVH